MYLVQTHSNFDDDREYVTLPEALASLGDEQLVHWDRDVPHLDYEPSRVWTYEVRRPWSVSGCVTAVVVHSQIREVLHVWCWSHTDQRWELYCEHTRLPVGELCACRCVTCGQARGSQDVSP